MNLELLALQSNYQLGLALVGRRPNGVCHYEVGTLLLLRLTVLLPLRNVPALALLLACLLVACAAPHHGTMIVTYVREGDIEAVQSYIDRGGDVNAKFLFDKTLLHHAIHKSQLDVAELLVEAGADIDAGDERTYTPLHWVAIEGQVEEARFLLNAGADLEVEDDQSLTPIVAAAWYGHIEVVQLLLNTGADVNHLLVAAASWNRIEVMKLALDAGAEVNPEALQLAAQYGCTDAVRLLLEEGADPNIIDPADGRLPIDWAIEKGYLDIVDLLTEHND